jgi:hypothetical protein
MALPDFPINVPIPISDVLSPGPAIPVDTLIGELRRWQPVRILRLLGNRPNEVEACKSLVRYILDRLGTELPPGVLADSKGKPGRPPSEKTFEIYERWLQLGQPKLNGPKLARAYVGQQTYRDAGKHGQKRYIDQCRAAVVRVRKKLPGPD